MKIFSVEIMIAATAYVKAESEADAVAAVQAFHLDGGEMREDEFIDGLPVSGSRFDSEDMPEVSISPAVTIYAENLSAEFVEDLDEEEEPDPSESLD